MGADVGDGIAMHVGVVFDVAGCKPGPKDYFE
jgi:hypothetical protein